MKKIILIVCLILLKASNSFSSDQVTFGNAVYVDLAVGESFKYMDRTIRVIKLKNHLSLIQVENEQQWLEVAKRSLPVTIGGLRIFVSDQINVKNLTSDPEKHNLLNKDVLLCISDPAKPLLDPSKFTFPISRADGYEWKMEENSHMFAYLGLSEWIAPGYYRSHEGMDLNMHEARGKEIHPLIAIEAATVVMVADSNTTHTYDGCIILKSDTQENIYYVYKHTHPKTHKVKVGQKVKKGQILSYIWGDDVWGHLHFAVVYRTETPTYKNRYKNLLNFFPQFYELHFGNLKPAEKTRNEGRFFFGHKKELCRNFKKLDEFTPLTGYGWKLGEWCISRKVEEAESDFEGNARLRKVLHTGTKAESKNPQSYYDFEIAVENGDYLVSATVGDAFLPSGQRVFFEGTAAGLFKTDQTCSYKKTGDFKVKVSDNALTLRLELIDKEQLAGIKELNFKKINK